MSEAAAKQGVVVAWKAGRVRRVRGHLIGSLVGRGESGPIVDYPGNPHGALPARATVRVDCRSPEAGVLLVFERERSDRPIVVGVVDPPEHTSEVASRAAPEVAAQVDGRRLVLEAQDEIVLCCGEASITLRRNGRVVIRGAYVETRARGINRVKGGCVQIN